MSYQKVPSISRNVREYKFSLIHPRKEALSDGQSVCWVLRLSQKRARHITCARAAQLEFAVDCLPCSQTFSTNGSCEYSLKTISWMLISGETLKKSVKVHLSTVPAPTRHGPSEVRERASIPFLTHIPSSKYMDMWSLENKGMKTIGPVLFVDAFLPRLISTTRGKSHIRKFYRKEVDYYSHSCQFRRLRGQTTYSTLGNKLGP